MYVALLELFLTNSRSHRIIFRRASNIGRAAMNANRIKLVQVARKALALDEEAYRAILREYGGVDSATALDDRSFAR